MADVSVFGVWVCMRVYVVCVRVCAGAGTCIWRLKG